MSNSMLLSDAIRIGCAFKPQGFGDFYRDGGSCALGAAYDGCGVDRNLKLLSELSPGIKAYFDETSKNEYIAYCPAGNGCTHFTSIPHLNDDHKWSRERIADFVETIEVKIGLRPAAAVKPEVTEVVDKETKVTQEVELVAVN